MNSLRFLFLLSSFLLITILWSGCDKIEQPYMTENQSGDDNDSVVRNFLLEEFTGHQCPNCPVGSREAKLLKEFYGDRLVIISIHAGWFANPMGSTFSYDFRTPEGNELNTFFGIEQNPVGLVNRVEFENSLILGPSAWGSAMAVLKDSEPDFKLALQLNQSSGNYTLEAEATALSNLDQEYFLVAVVTEDGIIKPQKVNDPDYPDGYIPDYEHNHVLRKGLTNIWGDKLNEENLSSGQSIQKTYTFSADSEWDTNNCHIVAYVMNQNLEVLQAQEIKFP